MLLPRRCGGCGLVGPSPCGCCVERLEPVGELELGGEVDRCLALVAYDALSAWLVAELKYRGVRNALPWLVTALAQLVVASGARPDVITWIPAARHNRRRRGFDQAELLARPLARRLGVPARSLLRRRPGTGQTGRTRIERLGGPELVTPRATQGTVLVVDDVITTGASMRAAAASLQSAGATTVQGAAVAYKR